MYSHTNIEEVHFVYIPTEPAKPSLRKYFPPLRSTVHGTVTVINYSTSIINNLDNIFHLVFQAMMSPDRHT